MPDNRWQQIEEVYHEALKRAPAARAAYLDEVCTGDEEVRRKVEALLAYDDSSGDFIEKPALEMAAQAFVEEQITLPIPLQPGQQLGAYQLQELLGRGGMGEVYLALDTRLQRKVALKLLPSQFTQDRERVRRFTQEARAASALNHPNILTIYDIGEHEQTHYIVTEFVEGETLRQQMTTVVKQSLAATVAVVAQIAEALAAAHEAGIIHRDIKPENVMLRKDGYVKVLDFGLAKLTEAHDLAHRSTASGIVMGTPRYMSPEQARGEKVDARTDIFSLGIMLYEMLARRAPFVGATASEVIAAILRDEPAPLPEALPEVQDILHRALQKERNDRYPTMRDLLADLKRLQRQLAQQEKAPEGHSSEDAKTLPQAISANSVVAAQTTGHRVPLPRGKALAAGAFVLLLVGGGWVYWRNTGVNKARAALVQIEELAKAERFFEAFDLAAAQRVLPNDQTLTRLMQTVADDLTVTSDPPGAQVYLKRFNSDASGTAPTRQLIGTTPINHHHIARGTYLVAIEKPGYASLERAVSGLMLQLGGMRVPSQPIRLEAKLVQATQVPARMVFVPGGEYRLTGWSRPTAERVRLDDYFIDKYEVTNREYKEFISAGGYLKREFWRYKFIQEGRELTWEEALNACKDQTSLPGPRSWKNQEIPEGKAEHPVTDITWYEAAAYAAFRGKELPTVFQWEKAARNGLTMDFGVIMPWGLFTGREALEQRANLDGRGTMPVASLEFGLSPFGCYHMAGNVTEWCRNPFDDGFALTGGSWGDPPYVFGNIGAFPGTYNSNKVGFRCVVTAPGTTGDQGTMALRHEAEIPVYKPVGEASFRVWQEQYYRYEKPPLEGRIIERKETEDWHREKITYVGAGGERAIAYLYLPKQSAQPYQVIQVIPPATVFQGLTPIDAVVEPLLAPFIKSGRAVLAVVLKGFREREWSSNHQPPAVPSVEYRDMVLDWMMDERRALDYLATRSELDSTRIAYFSFSSDSGFKFGLPAVEARYRAVILSGNCLRRGAAQVLPEIHPANLIPFIRAPKLMMHGRYDEGCRLKSEAEPLYKLMREPIRLAIYNGGHIIAHEFSVPTVNGWLDEVMGPVKRE